MIRGKMMSVFLRRVIPTDLQVYSTILNKKSKGKIIKYFFLLKSTRYKQKM